MRYRAFAKIFTSFYNVTEKVRLSDASWCPSLFDINSTYRKQDRVYTSLPLYHSAGGIVGVGMMLLGGATLVLSAHNKYVLCSLFKMASLDLS